jgi:lipopolysaccharide/colanic/teichoic acid biosynthesis glycosyltransferase
MIGVLLALWAGVTAMLATVVFRVFEVSPQRQAALAFYGVAGATVLFGALSALPIGLVVGAAAGWVAIAVFVGVVVVVGSVALALDRAGRWPVTETVAVIPLQLDDRDVTELQRCVPVSRAQQVVRRALDVVGSSLLLVAAAPLVALAIVAVKVDSRGPVFYSQARVGLGGQALRLRKLRSMSTDAELDGVARWAQTDDPRVTRVGRFLRRWRIDELPQLLDVLAGRMSLVGPRPERPEFVDELRSALPGYDVRYAVKPGLTGWAQVRFTYAASVDESARKLEYDLYYVTHRSVLFDLKILADTAPAVLFGRGSQ